MKFFFIGSSAYVLYLMKVPFRATYEPSLDTFRMEYLFVPSVLAALIFHYQFTLLEVLPRVI